MDVTLLIIISVMVIGLVYQGWLSQRIPKVMNFRIWLILVCSRYHIATGQDGTAVFNSLPSHKKMLYSFRGFDAKNWLTSDDYEKLSPYFN